MKKNNNVEIIRTYKGKKVKDSFFLNNRDLFANPHPISLQSAIDFLNELAPLKKRKQLYIDEFGEVSYLPPKEDK